MRLIVCIDDDGGMLFNNRRQSKDRVLRAHIRELTAGNVLWMDEYSYGQFVEDVLSDEEVSGEKGTEEETLDRETENREVPDRMNLGGECLQEDGSGQQRIAVDSDFLLKAGAGEYCFVEKNASAIKLESVEEIILCRWNRRYPHDVEWTFDMAEFQMTKEWEISGYSHEKITLQSWKR